MPPLRVLQLICPTGYYGAERWVTAQARHLDPNLVEVHLAATREGDDPTPELLTRAEALGLPAHEIRLQGRFDLAAPRAVAELAQRLDARILHTHGYKSDLLAVLARGRARAATLSTPHGFEKALGLKMKLYEHAGNWALRRCDRVAPLSPELAEELLSRGVAPEKIQLIENGVDLSEIDTQLEGSAPVLADGLRRLVYVGRLAPLKNLDGMLRALALLCERMPEARLRLIGEGPEEQRLRALTNELGVADKVEFMGYREDRLALLRECEIFAMCSRFEGIPRSMMEAMAVGLPAAAYEIPGTAKLIQDGVTGRLAPLDDPAALSEAWAQMLADQAALETMGQRARASIRERFSAARMARQYEILYEELFAELCARTH